MRTERMREVQIIYEYEPILTLLLVTTVLVKLSNKKHRNTLFHFPMNRIVLIVSMQHDNDLPVFSWYGFHTKAMRELVSLTKANIYYCSRKM